MSAGQPDGSAGGSEGLGDILFYLPSPIRYFELFLRDLLPLVKLCTSFAQAVHSLLDLGSFVFSGWSKQSYS